MSKESRFANEYIRELLSGKTKEELRERLRPHKEPKPKRLRSSARIDRKAIDERWGLIDASSEIREEIADSRTLDNCTHYEKNIENFIGTVSVPVGAAGPLRVNGLFAQGDYIIPLATTEAALVASYSRGAQLITAVGGCTAAMLVEGVGRSPGFVFQNVSEAGEFTVWVMTHLEELKKAIESTTNHGRFSDISVNIEGNHVYLKIEMLTGDAAGQNMVTIAAEALLKYVHDNSPIMPRQSFVEANMSGDKKANFQSFTSVRGKKVTAEVRIPERLVKAMLHTTPGDIVDYWRMSALGGVLSGAIGVQGHYANGLTALFLATGQDVACISEAAVGMTRMECTEEGDLYAAVTLPNLIVGTVGGGTGLPGQHACLEIMGLAGSGKSRAFSEVCAGLALAGELSIIGALSAGEFTRAHSRLARGVREGEGDARE